MAAAKEFVLGVDIGTSKIAAAAVDPDGQLPHCTVARETGADIPFDDPERKEQDPAQIRKVLFQVLEETLRRPELSGRRLRSIGLTGQMHGIIGLDEHGEPLTNLVTWQDGRGNRLRSSP